MICYDVFPLSTALLVLLCSSLVNLLAFQTDLAGRHGIVNTTDSNMADMTDAVVSSWKPCVLYAVRKTVDCQKRNLTQVPQDLLPDVEVLLLPLNFMSSVHSSFLVRYGKLKHLDMSKNFIYFIERTAFKPLKQLQYLNLYRNKLHEIPVLGSCGNVASVKMNLSYNQIHNVTSGHFSINCRTLSLDLTGNRIKMVDTDTLSSSRIRALFLGSYQISLPILSSLLLAVAASTMEQLRIESSRILGIPPGFFYSLQNKSLSLLSLSGNEIQLYPFIFANLTKLTVLELRRASITEVRPEYFDGMTGLHTLILDENPVIFLNPNNVKWNINVHTFSLVTHRLTGIREAAFNGLHNLTRLYVDHYSGRRIKRRYFDIIGLPNLQLLSISFCKMESLVLQAPRLKTLIFTGSEADFLGVDLFRNAGSIETIYMNGTDIMFMNDGFLVLPRLSKLYLDHNYYAYFGIPSLNNLSSLEELDLSMNSLYELPNDVFTGLVSLKILNLRGNKLSQFPPRFLDNMGMLTVLQLDSNELNYIDLNLFVNTNKLIHLSLADNRLATFNVNAIKPIRYSLKTINISFNPLSCSCEIKGFVEIFKDRLVNAKETMCSSASPVEFLRGKSLALFEPDHLCRRDVVLYMVIPTAVLVLAFVITIVYVNRWALRYKLFLLKLAVMGYKEMKDARVQGNFDYDLNIMFTDADVGWATEILRPALQVRIPNFNRIAFDDDDLILGMHYLDAVYHIVENSFKTVLLVSRAAVEDHIFMSKFRIALNNVTDTQTKNVVLVFLENVPDAELPYLVRHFLRDRGTYLDWPADAMGQECFWKELIKFLKMNLQR